MFMNNLTDIMENDDEPGKVRWVSYSTSPVLTPKHIVLFLVLRHVKLDLCRVPKNVRPQVISRVVLLAFLLSS